MSKAAAKEFADAAIVGNKVVVFSKSYCPFCKKAKAALRDAGLTDFKVIELEDMDNMDAIQDYMLELTKGRSVPRVFIGGKFVGGGDDVAKLQSQGKLKPMLQKVGAL
ncbi:glutaredoxin-C6-like [Acanthaster planci]|uniref:Glutaredoxin-2, mitochondrial n=1 Tax=Acanthaster planci TaxID=133434 RepID=A0A8B7YUA7_ACAPL|nr:glutaredoxin-C6-like [Acanthaster planci]